MRILKRLWQDESAATTMEYCFVVTFIAMVVLAIQGTVGGKLATKFTFISNGLN